MLVLLILLSSIIKEALAAQQVLKGTGMIPSKSRNFFYHELDSLLHANFCHNIPEMTHNTVEKDVK